MLIIRSAAHNENFLEMKMKTRQTRIQWYLSDVMKIQKSKPLGSVPFAYSDE